MVGVIRKGIRFSLLWIAPLYGVLQSGPFKPLTDGGGLFTVDINIAGVELDFEGGGIVLTAQIAHQHIVYEDPHIVIAGEFIGDRLVQISGAAVLMHKPGGHGHTKVVVHRAAGGEIGVPSLCSDLFQIVVAVQPEHLIRGGKREKLSPGVVFIGPHAAPGVIEHKGTLILIEPCVVGAFEGSTVLIVQACVIVKIAIAVDLKQVLDVGVRGFSRMLHVGVK